MAKTGLLIVTVKNFEKYKCRNDVDSPTWFKCSNRLIEDPDFYQFTFEEIAVWVQIMSLSSRKKAASVAIDFEHFDRACRLKKEVVESAIEKLQALGIISRGSKVVRRRNTDDPPVDQKRTTYRRGEEGEERKEIKAAFDFEAAYALYPKRVKGPKAEERFNEQIQTQQDYDDLLTALRHYTTMLALPENSYRQPKGTFEAFLGTKSTGFFWRDFISPESCMPTKTKSGAPLASVPKPVMVSEAGKEVSRILSEILRADGRHGLNAAINWASKIFGSSELGELVETRWGTWASIPHVQAERDILTEIAAFEKQTRRETA